MNANIITITPRQNIVGSVTHELKKELSDHISEGRLHLRVDLEEVTMIDSLGIGVLVATRNSVKDANGEFSIVNLSSNLTQLFSNMRILEFLNIESQ
jgi:anti-anti-sigma factor